nr:MAG TPA: hypothetical protein [Caudoviricetes sp.]
MKFIFVKVESDSFCHFRFPSLRLSLNLDFIIAL